MKINLINKNELNLKYNKIKIFSDENALSGLWHEITEIFKLSELHRDEKVILRIEGELLTLNMERGTKYKTGKFIKLR